VEHVVFFPAPDGSAAFRRVTDLEDAVRLVEHLRNVEGVHEASVHPLGVAVPLSFRTWYRVEVPAEADATPAAPSPVEPVADLLADLPAAEPVAESVPALQVVPEPEVAAAESVAVVPPQETPEPVAAEQNGAHGVKSLGFFAT